MVHYVLLKLKPGTDLDAAEAVVRDTYEKLAEALEFFHDPQVFRSCIQRDSNADIMACVTLDSADCLQPYLTHPLHMQMAQTLGDSLAGKTSFDHL